MKTTLLKILQSQGFGSRKECTWFIRESGVRIDGEECRDPKQVFETEGLIFETASGTWEFREHLYVMMNKPLGYECSHQSQHHESVFELLPSQFNHRKIQIAGRLDVETKGLLLLSDDGQFIHRVTSPKHGINKTYLVGLKHPFSEEQKARLLDGVELHHETNLFRALKIKEVGATQIEITIDRGCYHQVRRMIAAASNRVETLERTQVGELALSDSLQPGEWRYLDDNDLAALQYR